jgi:hypothetical protein
MSLAPKHTRTDNEDWQVANASDRVGNHGICHLFFKLHHDSSNDFSSDFVAFEQVFCCYQSFGTKDAKDAKDAGPT